jgi:hypothetical protein
MSLVMYIVMVVYLVGKQFQKLRTDQVSEGGHSK